MQWITAAKEVTLLAAAAAAFFFRERTGRARSTLSGTPSSPISSPIDKGKAYGKLCAGEFRQHARPPRA
ncbi:hypothetical protein HU200_017253 [Digitaria exilis]|uniref:Uncharacterized protein n=1 Tax=Digitaria exilis TaxID=1010633 RepID=A0A835F719_9POAL|nr:hypothetical protein HU200_017253 [Digitaria exilis]